jgi:Outer membrane lipoprotein carrier protein LolA-like
MISGTKTSERWRGVAAGAALLAALCLPQAARAFELGELMGWLAKTKAGQATFVEQREVKGFDEPLRSEGELSFAAPDRFERRTLKPVREAMRVEGNVLTMTRGGRSRTLALDAAPEAAAIVEAVRGTLTGNEATLQKHFRIRLTGTPEAWVLDLGPRAAALARQVSDVQIRGVRGLVTVVEVWMVGGDRSHMDITPLTGAAAARTAAASQPAASSP